MPKTLLALSGKSAEKCLDRCRWCPFSSAAECEKIMPKLLAWIERQQAIQKGSPDAGK